jgi:hypothetical protein
MVPVLAIGTLVSALSDEPGASAVDGDEVEQNENAKHLAMCLMAWVSEVGANISQLQIRMVDQNMSGGLVWGTIPGTDNTPYTIMLGIGKQKSALMKKAWKDHISNDHEAKDE